MNTTRIIFCAYDRPGYLSGGPNTWLRRLLPALRDQGFDVATLVIHAGRAPECPLIQWLLSADFAVTALSRDRAPFVEQQVQWILAQTAVSRPSVFVANLVTPAFYAARWLRQAGIPVVGVFHSDAPFCQAMAAHFVGARKADAFQAAVCVSNAILSSVAGRNRNGITMARIPCGAPVPEKSSPSVTGPLRILYVGRITQDAKRVLDVGRSFCNAAQQIPGTTYTLVGGGPEEEALASIINECPMRANIRFEGEISPEAMRDVFLRHDVIVLMSDYEGLPIALIEAMAYGLVPVCLAEKSGVDEVVSDGVNGLIIHNRESDFIRALSLLSADHSLTHRLSGEARRTVEVEYSSALNASRWAELLTQLSSASTTAAVKIPRFVKLPPPEPDFGSEDLRRPSAAARTRQQASQLWFRARQATRPRARVRGWIEKLAR